MKKYALLLACLLSQTVQAESLKVLWVGNSLTYFNKMPDLVTTTVNKASGPVQISSTQSVAGGKDWSFHLGKSVDEKFKDTPSPTLPHLQKKNDFDWVVIQNHSASALDEKYRFQEFGDELIGKIRATGAEPLIYCTMSRRAGEAYSPGDREKIINAYETLAKRQNAVIAPVGQAWKIAQEKRIDLDLFVKDGKHPNPVGGYLTACIFYSVFTGKSPIGIDLPRHYKFHDTTTGVDGSAEVTISDELASFLEQCAQQAMDETKAKGFRVTIQ